MTPPYEGGEPTVGEPVATVTAETMQYALIGMVLTAVALPLLVWCEVASSHLLPALQRAQDGPLALMATLAAVLALPALGLWALSQRTESAES